MTKVRLIRRGKWIAGFEIRGHSGYAQSGEDIVCAAISAISQTAVLGITEVLGIDAQCDANDEAGSLSLLLPEVGDERAQAILETMAIGLSNIQQQYPDFLRITSLKRR